jgi:hypothetical protein
MGRHLPQAPELLDTQLVARTFAETVHRDQFDINLFVVRITTQEQ